MDILQAHNKVSSAIHLAKLWSDNRNECEKAATLLRDTALKAIPADSPKTATERYEVVQKVEKMAQGDSLDLFAALMPYLLERRELARHYADRPDDRMLEMFEAINKEIAEILLIF